MFFVVAFLVGEFMKKIKVKSCFLIFLISFLMMLTIMFPNIISNKGLFIYSGDYNHQHISFTIHTYNMIHDGMVKSDLINSLGTDFMASYSHIVLTPFFLITLLMPSVNVAVLAIPVMTALKTAVASLTAYIYIKRYVKNDISAYIGALLYGFSGFQSFSLIFGSFHDITAWFPLMLLFMDEYFEDEKKSRFAVIVAAMAAMNAFFFYGQVVFLLIYFVVKVITKSYKITWKKFIGIVIESVIGLCISAVFLYPSVMTLASNSRVSSYIQGIDCLSYSDSSIVWRVLQSIFMMPDKAGSTSLFPGDNTWASISLYLPCAGIIFVSAYIKNNRKKWESVALIACVIMALVPALNSTFFMFNSSYYARWFYMPILIMALVTAKEIEKFKKENWMFGIKLSAIALILLAVSSLLPGEREKIIDGKSVNQVAFMGLTEDPIVFWRSLGIAGLFVLLIYLFMNKFDIREVFQRKLLYLVIAGTIVLNVIYINDVDNIDKDVSKKFNGFSLTEPKIDDDEFYRINGQLSNANLIWEKPAVDDFITTVPSSLVDFYDEFGISRTQVAYTDSRYYPLNALFSNKYYLNMATGDDLNVEYSPLKIEGFEKRNIQPYYHIYENKAFIPIGFSYNYYITEADLIKFTEKYGKDHPEVIAEENNNEESDDVMTQMLNKMGKPAEYNFEEKYLQKMLVMLRAIVISDEDEDRYSSIIAKIPEEKLDSLGTDTYYADCQDRKDQSCSEFEMTKDGFSAQINSDKENLVFFSVPYMEGWSAKVNGEDAEVVKVNYGFMAVKVDEGDNDIVFSYENPDYRTGGMISCVGLGMFAVYMIVNYMIYKRKDRNEVKG